MISRYPFDVFFCDLFKSDVIFQFQLEEIQRKNPTKKVAESATFCRKGGCPAIELSQFFLYHPSPFFPYSSSSSFSPIPHFPYFPFPPFVPYPVHPTIYFFSNGNSKNRKLERCFKTKLFLFSLLFSSFLSPLSFATIFYFSKIGFT